MPEQQGLVYHARCQVISCFACLLQVDARQLPPPELVYKDDRDRAKVMRVGTGEWNLRGLKFHTGATLGPFAVASFDRQDGEAGSGPDQQTSVEVGARPEPAPCNL